METKGGIDRSISGTGFWHWCENLIRRLIDILVSGLGMLLFFPAYLVIILMIKRDIRDPVTVTYERLGKDGRKLKIRKFRTTINDSSVEDGEPDVDRPGATRYGLFIREMKLDDLPQLWNVFVGDMSLTGPRPYDPKVFDDLPDEIRKEILSVRPGLTSPASILYRNMEDLLSTGSLTERDLREILPGKMRLDLIYIRNRNLLSDFDVVCWTAAALLPRLRAPEKSYKRNNSPWFTRVLLRPSYWFILDFFVSLMAVAVAGILQRLSGPLHLGMEASIGVALFIALIFSLCNLVMGLDKLNWGKANAGDALDLAIFDGVVMLLFFIGNRMVPGGEFLPAFIIIAGSVLSFAGFVLIRYQLRLISSVAGRWIALRGRGFDQFGERVLVVGAGEGSRFGIDLLRNGPLAQAYNLIGIVDDDRTKWGSRINGLEVIGSTTEIPGLVFSNDIGLVLFAISEIQPAETERIIELCRSSGVRVIQLPEVMDRLGPYYPKDEGEREALVGKVLQDTSRDRLTGAYNRQAFTTIMKEELENSRRSHQPCALIALEVRYMWPDGAARSRGITAQVLQVVVDRAMKHIREIDFFGRFGENELAILLPRTDQASANRLVERLNTELTATPVWTDRGPLNVSLGIAVLEPVLQHKDASVQLEETFSELHKSRKVEAEPPTTPIKPDPFLFERNP